MRLLEVLDERERHSIEQASKLMTWRRRQQLYVPGDASDKLFVLRSGVVKLSVASPEDREIILSFVHPGDVFGELAVVENGPRDHIAEAYENVVVHVIESEILRRLMKKSPRLGCEISRLMGARLKAYRTRLEELLYKSARARVARTLLDLAGDRGIPDAQGVVIPLQLRQRDIANLVGLTRETVNFVLKDLRQRHVIETQGRSIRVRAPEMLSALC